MKLVQLLMLYICCLVCNKMLRLKMEAQSMNKITREALFNQVRAWMLQAGSMIRESIAEPRTIDIKSNPKDLVTEMDREVELFFANKIKNYYPDHFLLGEEG